MLVALILTLPGLCQAVVVKCCPEDMSLTKAGDCKPSSHTWLYTELSVGLPNCSRPLKMVGSADEGSPAGCVDSLPETNSVAALVCDDPGSEFFPVPSVNFLRKCCPPGRKYSSTEQSCWSERVQTERRDFQGLLNVVLAGFAGPLDVETGAPHCGDSQVLVDYLVPEKRLMREESESVRIYLGHRDEVVFNPEEVCVDLTERHNVLVVRACQDIRLTCQIQGKTCIRKCCKDGHFISDSRCQLSQRPLDRLELYTVDEYSRALPVVGEEPAFAFGDHCSSGKFPLKPEETQEDQYYLLRNGSVYLPYHDTVLDMEEYCLEDVFSEVFDMNGLFLFLCLSEVEDQFPSEVDERKVYAESTGMIISCTFILITFTVYCCLPSLQNLHGKTLMCYLASLFTAFVCLTVVQLSPGVMDPVLNITCCALGFAIQFTFLAAFSWLSVICFDIWWTFGSMRSQIGRSGRDKKRFIVYSLYAWGLPSVFTAAALATQLTESLPHYLLPHVGNNSCWFSDENYGILLFFIGPETVMVGANVVFFLLTARNCSRVQDELNRFKHPPSAEKRFRADKNKLCMNAKLFVAMGVSWVLEVISWFISSRSKLWYAPDVANSLHGVYIFCIFVMKKKVRKALARRVGEMKCCGGKAKEHRPSVSTMFTVLSNEPRLHLPLTKSISDLKLSRITKTNSLTASVADFRLAK